MIKTNTKKNSSPKKTPAVAAKAPVAKKVSAPKKTTAKVTPKTLIVPQSVPTKKVIPKKVSAPKTTAVKAPPVSKKVVSVPVVKKAVPAKITRSLGSAAIPKIDTVVPKTEITTASKEGVKMLGILHLVGNLLSGGTLGIILVVGYLLVKKDTLSEIERATCYEIINFNLSFIVYMGIAVLLIAFIIGLALIPIVGLTWFVLLILGFLSHLVGENYKYPLTIRFIS